MKKNVMRLVTALLTVVLFIVPLVPAAQAAGGIDVKIPVEVRETGSKWVDTFRVVLTAVSEDAPMPEGSVDGEYILELPANLDENNAVSDVFSIHYPHVGIYQYTIHQDKGERSSVKYDKKVYDVTVYVTNNADYSGLEVTVAMRYEEDGEKMDKAVFVNYRKPDLPPNVPQTNDESNFPLYLGLSVASIVVLIGLFLTRKKEEPIE